MTVSHAKTALSGTPDAAPSTLLGVWPVPQSARTKRIRQAAVAGLVDMCVEQDVLPIDDPIIATFSDRRDVMLAAYSLGVPIADLLNVAELIGFGPRRLFVAATVRVRYAWTLEAAA